MLYERLHELELRRDALEAEEKNMISPQEERERLLKQVNTSPGTPPPPLEPQYHRFTHSYRNLDTTSMFTFPFRLKRIIRKLPAWSGSK